MPKKRILHVIQSLGNGGCENMLFRTLPRLSDFEHKIITLKEPGELAPKFVSVGITVEAVRCASFFDIFGIHRLRKLLRKENPDVIITYLFHADMIGRLALRNIISAPIIPFLRTTYNHPKYLIARILEWITRPLVSQYLANSEAVKDFYVNNIGVRPEKITIIPNGLDISVYENANASRIIQEFNLPGNRFVITCIANLALNKGHYYLLKAFEDVFQKHPGSYLLLIGEGPERDNLENQTRDYRSQNHIFFLGRRTDIPDILKASDCFVLPTLFEGMSNALLEAMAARLPIITTDIPENRILLQNDYSGILVPAQDSLSLCTAINELYDKPDLRMVLGENARERARSKYGLTDISQLWRSFLNTQLREK